MTIRHLLCPRLYVVLGAHDTRHHLRPRLHVVLGAFIFAGRAYRPPDMSEYLPDSAADPFGQDLPRNRSHKSHMVVTKRTGETKILPRSSRPGERQIERKTSGVRHSIQVTSALASAPRGVKTTSQGPCSHCGGAHPYHSCSDYTGCGQCGERGHYAGTCNQPCSACYVRSGHAATCPKSSNRIKRKHRPTAHGTDGRSKKTARAHDTLPTATGLVYSSPAPAAAPHNQLGTLGSNVWGCLTCSRLRSELEISAARLQASTSELEAARRAAAATTSELSTSTNEARKQNKELSDMHRRLIEKQEELSNVRQTHAKQLDAASKQLDAANKQLYAVNKDLDAAKKELDAKSRTLSALNKKLDDKSGELLASGKKLKERSAELERALRTGDKQRLEIREMRYKARAMEANQSSASAQQQRRVRPPRPQERNRGRSTRSRKEHDTTHRGTNQAATRRRDSGGVHNSGTGLSKVHTSGRGRSHSSRSSSPERQHSHEVSTSSDSDSADHNREQEMDAAKRSPSRSSPVSPAADRG